MPAFVPATAPKRRIRGLYQLAATHVQTPDAASLDITADIEIVVQLARADWTTGDLVILSKRSVASDLSWQLGVTAPGGLTFSVRTGGVNYFGAASGASPGLVDGEMYWFRIRRTAATGAVTMHYAPDSDEEPINWTALTVTGAQPAGALDPNDAPLELGAHSGGAGGASGTYRRFMLRDGIAGTTVADWRGDLPANPYRDATGKLWTIAGPAGWGWEGA